MTFTPLTIAPPDLTAMLVHMGAAGLAAHIAAADLLDAMPLEPGSALYMPAAEVGEAVATYEARADSPALAVRLAREAAANDRGAHMEIVRS